MNRSILRTNRLLLGAALACAIAAPASAAVIAVMDGGGPTAFDSTHSDVIDLSTGGDSAAGITGSFSVLGDGGVFASDSTSHWNDTEWAMQDSGPTFRSATWTFSGLSHGSVWEAYTTWPALTNRATNAPYTVSSGASNQTILVNQELAPASDLVLNDGTSGTDLFDFQSLGTITAAGGEIEITLSTDADEFVIFDAVAIRQTTVPEPAAFHLLALSGLVLLLRRR